MKNYEKALVISGIGIICIGITHAVEQYDIQTQVKYLLYTTQFLLILTLSGVFGIWFFAKEIESIFK